MAFLGQEEQIRELQDRFRYLYVVLFIGLGILLSRMVYLQILQGEKLNDVSEKNRIKRVKIASPRGMMFDRNRKLLMDNRPAFDLEIIPQYLRESKQTKQVVSLLSSLIHLKEEEIYQILKKKSNQPAFMPVKIKTDLTREEVAAIETRKIEMPGIEIREEIKRTNVYGEIASHMLGYIGEVTEGEIPQLQKRGENYVQGDMIGKFGLEQKLESYLRGIDGEELREVDALGRAKLDRKAGRVLSDIQPREATPGKNLILNIDQELQLAAVKAMGDKVGSVVALDPRNGQILAMISKPSFDATEFSRGIPSQLWQKLLNNDDHPLMDKTIQDHYPPGSTFKLLTAIVGLEEGVIDEHSSFHCTGSIKLGNRVIRCWKKEGHGTVNVNQAITKSCDTFFYRVAQKLKSVDDIAKWAFRFGLGKKTGVPLPREIPGLIPTEAWKMNTFKQPWTQGETINVAIGQGYVLTTAIQLANLYATFANGGVLYRPYLVQRIETYDGQLIKEFQPEVIDNAHLKPKTMELVRKGLWDVVNTQGGTAYASRLPLMDFAGKTGTAQVVRLGKIITKCENMRYRERDHGLFVGVAPANDPVIAVAVVAEHACHGASGAAPVARAVIKSYLERFNPQLYSEKAVLARLKSEGQNPNLAYPSGQVPKPTEDEDVRQDEDEAVPQNSQNTETPPAPKIQNEGPQ